MVIGDPRRWLHPVQAMGIVIAWSSEKLLQQFTGKWPRLIAGGALGLGVIGGSGVLTWGLMQGLQSRFPLLTILVQIMGVASCLATTSLAQAAQQVITPLQKRDLVTARQALSYFVGRDTGQLSETDIVRATVESIAENTVDGVTAPLFYALLGALIPSIGPLPLAMAYKAASTLDSMIGYRREPYTYLGTFSAQLEDCLTWLPCRLTVLGLALLSGRPIEVIQMCQRDAPQDPSPNSGWSEAVYAASLAVQLGGDNYYQGELKAKPLLGNPHVPLTLTTVQQAIAYTRMLVFLEVWGGCLGLLNLQG